MRVIQQLISALAHFCVCQPRSLLENPAASPLTWGRARRAVRLPAGPTRGSPLAPPGASRHRSAPGLQLCRLVLQQTPLLSPLPAEGRGLRPPWPQKRRVFDSWQAAHGPRAVPRRGQAGGYLGQRRDLAVAHTH